MKSENVCCCRLLFLLLWCVQDRFVGGSSSRNRAAAKKVVILNLVVKAIWMVSYKILEPLRATIQTALVDGLPSTLGGKAREADKWQPNLNTAKREMHRPVHQLAADGGLCSGKSLCKSSVPACWSGAAQRETGR